jgi:hypothetical protein
VQLPVVGNDAELEERILQHLAAAAAMGRTHHLGRSEVGRREGHRGRSGSHNRPQFLVFSAHPNSPSAGVVSSSAHGEGDNDSNPVSPRAVSSPRANFSGETGNQSPGMLTYDAEQDAVVSSGNSTPVSSPRFFNRYPFIFSYYVLMLVFVVIKLLFFVKLIDDSGISGGTLLGSRLQTGLDHQICSLFQTL